MNDAMQKFIEELVLAFPALEPVVAESREDNYGETLPHLILADTVRWLARGGPQRRELAGPLLAWLERAYEQGNRDVRDLIVVSGVEMIPNPGDRGAWLRELLGPVLSAFDPWNGSSNSGPNIVP